MYAGRTTIHPISHLREAGWYLSTNGGSALSPSVEAGNGHLDPGLSVETGQSLDPPFAPCIIPVLRGMAVVISRLTVYPGEGVDERTSLAWLGLAFFADPNLVFLPVNPTVGAVWPEGESS